MTTLERRRPVKSRERKKGPVPESSSSPTSIDELPESLLTHIISFLPTPDAIQASAVAPPWRNLWHSIPVIDFDMRTFQRSRPPLPLSDARRVFAKMLNCSLFQRPRFPIKKFKLSIAYKDYYHIQSYVNSWLMFVLISKPEELDLDFSESEYEDDDEEDAAVDLLRPFVFHYFVLVNSSVKVLKLNGCDLCKSPGIPVSFKIYSLREMHLEEVNWSTKEELVHLLAICDNLEKLTLVNVEFVRDWKIESKSLKHFAMLALAYFDHWDYSVEICAPSLESLILREACDGKYTLKDTSALVEAVVEVPERDWRDFAFWANLVRSLDGVEWLSIQNMWRCKYLFDMENRRQQGDHVIEQHVDEVFSETFVFRNLKHVELLTGYSEDDILGLQILLKKCPQLETMALVNKYKPSTDLKEGTGMSIVLQMPHLRLVEMKKFQKTESELLVVGLLKKHGAVLEKIVAYSEKVNGESRHSFIL